MKNLGQILRTQRHGPGRITFLANDLSEREVSHSDLYDRARGLLGVLQGRGLLPGDKIIIVTDNNEQFVYAFWAAVLGGIVPVPVYCGVGDEHHRKLLNIVRQLRGAYLFTERDILEKVTAYSMDAGETSLLDTLESRAVLFDELEAQSALGIDHVGGLHDLALIQFSSGSTSEPKGIMLTHDNLIANCRGIIEASEMDQSDIALSWMPLTHDMGLIGVHLINILSQTHVFMMSTDLFARRPLLWMTMASRVSATILYSPNFGFKHYLKALGDRSTHGLNLASVRLIVNGAEPISASLCHDFMARLASTGLRSTAMYPVYGLAEASVAVSFPRAGSALRTIVVDRHHLNIGDHIKVISDANPAAIEFVCEGTAIPYCELRIADETGVALDNDKVGHVQIRGDNVTSGYFDNPDATADTITQDGWRITGDIGLYHDGGLYICGRSKELIIVNGQNYFPHDIEAVACRHGGLELGKVVATSIAHRNAEGEELIVFVLHRRSVLEFLPICHAVATSISEHIGLEVGSIVPVKRIPKTTSGKSRRHVLRDAYLNGGYTDVLRALEDKCKETTHAAATPKSRIEGQILEICHSALTRMRIDVHDNLFETGISSLKLIAIHEQIDERFPGMIVLSQLYEFPTVAQMAAQIARFQESSA